jgi:hypothetical protein
MPQPLNREAGFATRAARYPQHRTRRRQGLARASPSSVPVVREQRQTGVDARRIPLTQWPPHCGHGRSRRPPARRRPRDRRPRRRRHPVGSTSRRSTSAAPAVGDHFLLRTERNAPYVEHARSDVGLHRCLVRTGSPHGTGQPWWSARRAEWHRRSGAAPGVRCRRLLVAAVALTGRRPTACQAT